MRRAGTSKTDRAIELHEKGMSNAVIAERIGSTQRTVASLIKNAKAKRIRQAERVRKIVAKLGANV